MVPYSDKSHAHGQPACKAGKLRQPACLLILLWLFALPILPAGCRTADPAESERLVKLVCESRILDKIMQLMIWLPEDYAPDRTYPVLYFPPDYGGSAYTVIHEYLIGRAADELTRQGLIESLIIVAVSMDRSFGLNSGESRQRIETAGGKTCFSTPAKPAANNRPPGRYGRTPMLIKHPGRRI